MSWLTFEKPDPGARMRLFCLPYAGGGASVYRSWVRDLPRAVELGLVHLPGRDMRLRESPATRLSKLVQDLAPAILPYIDKPAVFFGHSMGAMIGFELIRELRLLGAAWPVHFFASALPAPQIGWRGPKTYGLPEPQFLDVLRRLNGTPEMALKDSDMRAIILPILRADFELVQTYKYVPGAPLQCPITVFGGMLDAEVRLQDLAAWRRQTIGSFAMHMFEGDHFFLRSEQGPLLQCIIQEIDRSCGLITGERRGRRC